MNTPRIRTDLQATPTEEAGIKYFDVSDPKSGAHMRMYDFEWLIAERMDGRRAFDEVASWAKERLGITPSSGDLQTYAERLRELGFFDGDAEPLRAPPSAPTMMTPAPAKIPLTALAAETSSSVNGASSLAPPLPAPEAPRPARSTGPHATAPTAAMAAVKPEELPVAAPLPRRQPSSDTDELPRYAEPKEKTKSGGGGGGSLIALLLVAVVVGGGIYGYVTYFGNAATKVATAPAATRQLTRFYDGQAPVKKADEQTLSFGENGRVSDIVAAGTEAKAGMPLATLESFAKIEKELLDVKDRATFYEKQLAGAKAKNDADAIKSAEAKVNEKKKLLAELEARAGKVRLVAPGAATVAQVMLAAGADAKAGQPAIKLSGKRSTAELTLLAGEGAAFKEGQTVSVGVGAGAGAVAEAHVRKVAGDVVTVEIDDEAVKPGDPVRLVKAQQASAVAIPASAVLKRDGHDVVFVLGADGLLRQRAVTIVDRGGTDVLVGSGVTNGEQVVTSGADTLHDGDKAAK